MLTYGLRSLSLHEAARSVARAIGATFELHESSFRGGDYYRTDVSEGTIYVQSNFDPLDDEPFNAAWPPDQYLLYFNGFDDNEWDRWTKRLNVMEAEGTAVFLQRGIS